MAHADRGEGVVDAVGHPEQRQLAQRRQVAGAEVVAERGVDLVGGVHVAVGQPSAQCLRRHVDELDLIGRPYHAVGHRLALADPGDPFDDVVERLEVLDVNGGDDVDAGGEELVDVLVALGVARARRVGVGELVDETSSGRRARMASTSISSTSRRGARPSAGHHLEAGELLRGVDASMGLGEPDDHVGAALAARRPSLSMAKVLPTPGAAPR